MVFRAHTHPRTRISNIILGIIYLCHTLVKHLGSVLTKFFIFRMVGLPRKTAVLGRFWAGVRAKNGTCGRTGCGGAVRPTRLRWRGASGAKSCSGAVRAGAGCGGGARVSHILAHSWQILRQKKVMNL